MPNKKRFFPIFYILTLLVLISKGVFAVSLEDINKNLKVSKSKLNQMEKVIVKKVADGDTFFTYSNKTIRLIGVNTPEVGHHNTKIEFMGKKASKYTKKRLKGKTVYLDYGIQKFDKYDRTLAYVFLENGKFFNAELVQKGYAELMTIPPNVEFTKLFQRMAQKARNEKIGLWKKTREYNDLKVINWDEAGEYINEKVAVKGKVIDTYDSGSAIFLNFHKDYKHTFTAVIFKSDEYKFDFEPEKKYLNRTVLVKGKIKVYKGAPEIVIEEPAQIEIVK